MSGTKSGLRPTLLLCCVEILGLAGIATFPALLPRFLEMWQLSHTQAGWINAVYFGAYMLAVPFLSGITDRIDARYVLLFGVAAAMVAAVGFALAARGFWTALAFRLLAGISLAGIYMPGLKLVGDFTEGPKQSRYVSFYTASFAIGCSLSFLMAGEVETRFGWNWAFLAAAAAGALAFFLIALWIPEGRTRAFSEGGLWKDFLPVLRSPRVMGYVFGYAAHMWELFAMRSWIVAFLFYTQGLQPEVRSAWTPAQVAFIINLLGLPASIGGNELSRLLGRRKVIITVMCLSVATGSVIGFLSSEGYTLVMVLSIVWGIWILGDSASLIAGSVSAAPEGYRGATLAVHSTLGFGAAFLSPLAVGIVLDATSHTSSAGWGPAFLVMVFGCALGPVALLRLGGRSASR
jgi:MFS family permease